MAYIRVKKIRKKGKEYRYAYLVENRWKKRTRKGSKKGARQKVKGYLGKVYSFSKEKGINDGEAHFDPQDVKDYLDANGMDNAIRELIRIELMNHGFMENGNFYANGDLAVYISDKDFFIKNIREEKDRKIVIAMNEGFLCKETFSRLINFKAKGDEKEIGLSLGNAVLEAGLNMPKEIFVGMFERVVR